MAAICSKCLRTVVDDSLRCGPCGGPVVRFDESVDDEAAERSVEFSAWNLPKLFEDLDPSTPSHCENER